MNLKSSPFNMFLFFRVIIILLIFALQGCCLIPGYERLMQLKKFGDNRREIEQDLKKQEKFFNRLRNDIKNVRLRKGMSETQILSRYGQPILSKRCFDRPGIYSFLLYRHPTQYLDSHLIYLYFNENECLDSWEVI